MNLRLVDHYSDTFILDVDEMPKSRRRFAPKPGPLPRPGMKPGSRYIEVSGLDMSTGTFYLITSGLIAGIVAAGVFGIAFTLPGAILGAGICFALSRLATIKWETRMNLVETADILADESFIHPAPPGADTSHLRLRSRSRILTPISDNDARMIRESHEGAAAMFLLVRLDRISEETYQGMSVRMKLRDDEPVRHSVDFKLEYLNDERDAAMSELKLIRSSHRIEADSQMSLDNQDTAQKWLDGDGE